MNDFSIWIKDRIYQCMSIHKLNTNKVETECKEIISISRTKAWQLVKFGDFPARKKLDLCSCAWLLSERSCGSTRVNNDGHVDI